MYNFVVNLRLVKSIKGRYLWFAVLRRGRLWKIYRYSEHSMMNSIWFWIACLGTLPNALFSYGVHKKSTYNYANGGHYTEDSKGNIYDPEGNCIGNVADLAKYNGDVVEYFNYVKANEQKYPGDDYPTSKDHAGYDTTTKPTYKHVDTGYHDDAKKYPEVNYHDSKDHAGYDTTTQPTYKHVDTGYNDDAKKYPGDNYPALKDHAGYYTTTQPTYKHVDTGYKDDAKKYPAAADKNKKGYGGGFSNGNYNKNDNSYKDTSKDYKPGTDYDSKDYHGPPKDTNGHDATYKHTSKEYKPGTDYDNKDYHGPPKDTHGHDATYKHTSKEYKPGTDYDSKDGHGTPYSKDTHDHGKTYSRTTERYADTHTGYKSTVKPPVKYCENGCLDRKVCHALKDVWTIRCNLYQCIWDDKLQKPKLDILFLGCRVKDGSQRCVRPGEKGVFTRGKDICYEFQCKCGKRKCNWKKLYPVCEEPDGKCRKIGDIFKCKYFKGYTKCECIKSKDKLYIKAHKY